MIAAKDGKNNTKNLLGKTFEEIRNLNIERREKIVQRQILAVEEFIAKSREKNSAYSWNHCPWAIQFLPVITKFFKEWGKINAVNPALSGLSGLMGLSKLEINKRLNSVFRPKNIFLKTIPKSREILEKKFHEKYNHGLLFPLIFKPNIGERCTGVHFVSEEKLTEFLSENVNLENIIMEEFIETTQEFGLSWIFNPINKKVEIITLTERELLKVTGNGKTSLQNLIIQKCKISSVDLERQNKIIAGFSNLELKEKIIGERTISRAASVSYGTISHKIKLPSKQKASLEKLVPQIITDFSGLHAGRFDLKSNSLDDLVSGKCKVLEMNGIAGTPLDIYDNEISIKEKYQILFDYFSRILDIADKNIASGEGKAVPKIEGVKNLARLFFGKNKTQELPKDVWKNLREVFKISLKGRFKASDLGKVFQKFRN